MRRIFLVLVLTLLYGMFFNMKPVGIGILLGGTAFAAIFWERFRRTEESEKRDFFQLTEYMQGMGMSFLLSGAEYPALKETITLFDDCEMRERLCEARRFMESNYDGKGAEGAFLMIEKNYACKKLTLLHNYILTASKVGGEFQSGIRLLLSDQDMWKKRQSLAYEDLRGDKRRVTIAVLLTIILCGYVAILAKGQIDITHSPVYQIGMVCFWFCCIGVIALSQKLGKMDWLEKNHGYSPEEIQEKIMRHRREEKHHKIGYETRKNILRKELIKAFPEWMLEVALRMESKNVEVALEESYEYAPVIIRYYLGKMLAELKEHPGEGEAYFRFASELHVPEITNSMKLLYGMSKGVIAGGEEQIRELIERNYRMEDQAATYRMEKKRSAMYGCSLLPSLFGAGCMILNMSLLLIGFMGNLKL